MDDHRETAKRLKRYLAERDVACPGCGCSLRGLTIATCPECRQALRLTVELAEGRIGSLVACLGPLFAGAGAAAALLVTVGVTLYMRAGPWPGRWESFVLIWIPLGCLVMCGVPAAALSRRQGRVWFRRLSHGSRVEVVGGSIAVPVLWLLVLLGIVLWGM